MAEGVGDDEDDDRADFAFSSAFLIRFRAFSRRFSNWRECSPTSVAPHHAWPGSFKSIKGYCLGKHQNQLEKHLQNTIPTLSTLHSTKTTLESNISNRLFVHSRTVFSFFDSKTIFFGLQKPHLPKANPTNRSPRNRSCRR